MALKTTCVKGVNSRQIAENIYNDIHQDNEKLVMFFASVDPYNFEEVSKELKEKFQYVDVVGCSTAGELITGQGPLDGSITAISFGYDKVEAVKVFTANIRELETCESDFKSFRDYFVGPTEIAKYVGLALMDGSSMLEEVLMDKLGNAAPDLVIVGGSAGDGMNFGKTHVSYNGKVLPYGVVIPVLKMRDSFEIIQTSSYKATSNKFVATKTSPDKRLIHEINGINAVEFYKQNVKADAYDFGVFATHPIGIELDGGNAFVRSLQNFTEDGSLLLYCSVDEGTQLCFLEPTDIIQDMETAVASGISNLEGVSGGVLFSCILQKIEITTLGKGEEFANLLNNRNLVGFFTYGEQYIAHMNQTLTGLLIK